MTPLFEAIVDHVPSPDVDPQARCSCRFEPRTMHSTWVLGIGRVTRGTVAANLRLRWSAPMAGNAAPHRRTLGFYGLERVRVEEAGAGDIVAFSGVDSLPFPIPCVIRSRPRHCHP